MDLFPFKNNPLIIYRWKWWYDLEFYHFYIRIFKFYYKTGNFCTEEVRKYFYTDTSFAAYQKIHHTLFTSAQNDNYSTVIFSRYYRWMCEGRISFNQPHKIISSYNLNIQYHLLNMKWQAFMMDIRNFTRSLNLKHLPTPNLFHLAERYCEELNLPSMYELLNSDYFVLIGFSSYLLFIFFK